MVQRDGAVLDAGGYARFSAERSSGLRLGAVPATSRTFPGPVDRLAGDRLAVAHELADLADAVPSARRLRAVTFLLVGQLLVPGIAHLGPRSHRARLRTPRSRRGQSDHTGCCHGPPFGPRNGARWCPGRARRGPAPDGGVAARSVDHPQCDCQAARAGCLGGDLGRGLEAPRCCAAVTGSRAGVAGCPSNPVFAHGIGLRVAGWVELMSTCEEVQ